MQGLTQGSAPPPGEAEIEGLVTAVLSATRFRLGDFEVDASQASVQPAGTPIAVGARLDVDGVWQSGALLARKIEVEDQEVEYTLEIKGRVEQFTSVADFVVRSQRCDASRAAVSHGTLATDLRLGAYIKVQGTQAGGVLQATELEFEN